MLTAYASSELPSVLADSAKEAWEISVREHVKASRIERVGHFVTCIRRFLTQRMYFTRRGVYSLLQKGMWYDVLVLDPEYIARFTKQERDELDAAIKAAKALVHDAAARGNIIDPRLYGENMQRKPLSDIDEIRQRLEYCRQVTNEVSNLTGQADKVLDKLLDVMDNETPN